MPGRQAETIVVVDDDAAKRHAIAKILRRAGYGVREGQTGADALRLAAEKPALIVLDVQLPDVSGFEICRRIKEDPATAAIPVLHVSTTFVDIEDRVYGLEGGADGYLTDVLEPVELVATVKALLRARRAEEAAHISSKQWQVTFDSISDGVLLLDRRGRALQCNSAMEGILGRSWDALSGETVHDVLSLPPDPGRSPFLRMLESGRREAVELTLGERWLRVTVDPIRDADGAVRGGLCIASDVTDRMKLEDELRRRAEELVAADRRKDEFLAMLAHELRNPLAPISNALEVIRRTSARAAMEEALGIAGRQVRHMARLLDDLLDVARFTRGDIRLQMVPIELTAVLRQAVDTARPLIEAGAHAFTAEYPADPLWILGDPTRLAQVVANLLNNAAKYTDRGGRISLEAAAEGPEAVIRVVDDGIGLDEEMLTRAFDLFAQEDRSLARSQGGLGIGLTLVRSLVQLHGGSVVAESEGKGRGSRFTVRLPIPQHAGPAGEATNAPDRSDGPPPPLRILVVDDSLDSARSLSQCLELWGYGDVHVANDGPGAVAAALARAFDVILLDIGLPGMDGYQVAERLRDHFGPVGPVLVALTGYGQAGDAARSLGVGFDHHLVKPVNLPRLRAMLADPALLEGRGGRRTPEE